MRWQVMNLEYKTHYRFLGLVSIWMVWFILIFQPVVRGFGQARALSSQSKLEKIDIEGIYSNRQAAGDTVTTVYLPGIYNSSSAPSVPRVNIPQITGSTAQRLREAGVFWFGEVGLTDNYTDVRVSYDQDSLLIGIAIFDRLLWYDTSPTIDTLAEWDSVEVFLSTHGNQGNYLDDQSYRFVAEANRDVPLASEYSATYRGNGTTWEYEAIPFTGIMSWRSGTSPFFNDLHDDFGWMISFEIPFSSFGLNGPPADGSIWGLSIKMNDRDNAGGASIPPKTWPSAANFFEPKTWGQMVFGLPGYTPAPYNPGGTTTIRNGENGVVVRDVMVGGNTTCGEGLTFWTQWGNTNYHGATQLNVQNQWDVSDQPCFSKVFIRFPLNTIPSGNVIVSASLTMYQFGNSDPSGAVASMIQLFVLDRDWDEGSITWNNAPQSVENVSRTRVDPLPSYPGLPGVARTWNVSKAVSDAYRVGSALNLGIYDADMPMHSGKYFHSSNVDAYMATSRPVLTVVWGQPK